VWLTREEWTKSKSERRIDKVGRRKNRGRNWYHKWLLFLILEISFLDIL